MGSNTVKFTLGKLSAVTSPATGVVQVSGMKGKPVDLAFPAAAKEPGCQAEPGGWREGKSHFKSKDSRPLPCARQLPPLPFPQTEVPLLSCRHAEHWLRVWPGAEPGRQSVA